MKKLRDRSLQMMERTRYDSALAYQMTLLLAVPPTWRYEQRCRFLQCPEKHPIPPLCRLLLLREQRRPLSSSHALLPSPKLHIAPSGLREKDRNHSVQLFAP